MLPYFGQILNYHLHLCLLKLKKKKNCKQAYKNQSIGILENNPVGSSSMLFDARYLK